MKISSTSLTFAAIVGSLMLSTTPVRANPNLIGVTVTATGTDLSPPTATIGPGIEFTGISGDMNFDFDANSLTVTSQGNLTGWGGFGPYTFSGFTEPITSLSIGSNNGFAGKIVDNFSFTTDSITLDMSDGSVNSAGGTLVFNINSSTNSVPDAGSSLAMLGGSLIGLAALRRRFGR
jgi:hypothetical protein